MQVVRDCIARVAGVVMLRASEITALFTFRPISRHRKFRVTARLTFLYRRTQSLLGSFCERIQTWITSPKKEKKMAITEFTTLAAKTEIDQSPRFTSTTCSGRNGFGIDILYWEKVDRRGSMLLFHWQKKFNMKL